MNFKDMYREKGSGGPPMLHGSDVPTKIRSVTIKVKDVREPPKGFKSICILDIDPVYECEAFAVNKTNNEILLDKFGLTENDDIPDLKKKIVGKKLTLIVVMVNDPTKDEMVRGLQFS